LGGRKRILPVKLSDVVLAWLCLEQGAHNLHMVGSADVTATLSSLASLKSRMVLFVAPD